MTWRIPLADLNIDEAEEAAVLAVLRSKWLTMGAVTAAFEEEFAAFVGAKHALAVTNCTAALHMAYAALDLKPGDEVIVPSLTFVATANAVSYVGATPVFCDIVSEDDFGISAEKIPQHITPRTKAIVVVHYAGYACDMPRIQAIANDYGLAVIEDAAHAPGATLHNRALGTWGHIGCFSFFSNKNLATGEGGMLVTNDDATADKLRLLRSHGMTTLTWERHRGHAFSYDVMLPGHNFRIDEMRSAIGRVQLGKLQAGNARRRQLNALYEASLPTEVGVPYRQHAGVSSCHIRPILLPPNADRHHFMQSMKAQGIQTSIHYPPVHQFSWYRGRGQLPLTEAVARREVTLPLYPGMRSADVATVVAAVQNALAKQTV